MNLQRRSFFFLALVVAAAGCEDTPLLVPSDAQILIVADPAIAEEGADDPDGLTLFSTIQATVLNASGQVLSGREVTFTRTAGELSINGFDGCIGGTCENSGGSCTAFAACQPPSTGPIVVETDSGGRARVELAADNEDPISVTVTATSGAKTASVTVQNPIGMIPEDPEMDITAVSLVACEADGTQQCIYNLTATFQAVEVTPGLNPITCYEWRLQNTQPIFTPVFGATLTSFLHPFNNEHAPTVILAVTNEDVDCDDATAFEVTVQQVFNICDPANAPPTVTVATSTTSPQQLSGGSATFAMTSTADDPEQGALTYSWDCGVNGVASDADGTTTNCTYSSAGAKTITLAVRDPSAGGGLACARVGSDQHSVQVNP